METCLIDDSLTTAVFSYPVAQGWVAPKGLEVVSGLTAEMVAARNACALIDSVEAALLLNRFAVVTDIALVSHHTGAIRLWTANRPDEIEHASISLNGVSRTAEAIARATIFHFFAIDVIGWDRRSSDGDAIVREGAPALTPVEAGYLNDLVRAWFILSGSPLATHVLVAPRELAEQGTRALQPVVKALDASFNVATERRRQLRRDLEDATELDRDQLVEFQTDQTVTLSKTARKGWLDLVRRVGRAMNLPNVEAPVIVTVNPAG